MMLRRCFVICCLAACGRMGFDARVGDPDDPQGPGAARLTYAAAIAECIDPNAPDLSACDSMNGPDQLVVDGKDGTTESPWQAYLRFELDAAFDGMTIVAVRLVMTVTDDDKAAGPDSGDLWQVAPFDRTALAGGPPATIGNGPLAESRGSVESFDVVAWELPPALAVSSASIHLGVITADDSGGVNYWNLAGRDPPRLEIDLE